MKKSGAARSRCVIGILLLLVACGSDRQSLTTTVAPPLASTPASTRREDWQVGLTDTQLDLVNAVRQQFATQIANKPPKTGSFVRLSNSSPGGAQIFQGDPDDATVEDAALVLAFSYLSNTFPSQEDLKTAAGTLLGDRDRLDGVTLDPALGNATANYVSTANGDVTLEDVAAVLAARELAGSEFDESLLAETATRAIAPVSTIQATQILRLPIASATPTPSPSPSPEPTLPPNAIGIPDRREGSLSNTDAKLTLGESVDFFELDLSEVKPGDSVTATLNSDTFDPYLLLVNQETNLIVSEDDDSGDGLNSRLAFTVAPDVGYRIGVTSYSSNETGTYVLETTVSKEPFTTLSVPGTLNGILDNNDELIDNGSNSFAEFLQLSNVTPGQSITLNLSSDDFDTVLVLFGVTDQGEETIGFNDDIIDGRGTSNSQFSFLAEANVRYVAAVTSFGNGETGSYRLRASTDSDASTPAPTPSPSPTASPTPSPSPTVSPTPTISPSPLPTATPSPTPRPPQDLRPNDPLYAQQYGFESINMPPAWGSGLAVNPVAIAVIDDGVMAGNHPDLPPRSSNNARFLTQLNSFGQAFGFNDARGEDAADTPYVGQNSASAFNNPTHHGTHVAGTVAAIADNGEGVAGTVWGGNENLDVELISINTFQFLPQFSDKQFLTLTSDYIEAIRYAAGLPNRLGQTLARPVDAINMSLGGLGSCPQSTESAIADAVAQGVTVVIAAGNDSTNQPASPASCPSVTLTVGATDRNDNLANFSNYNFNDISAPGVGILSTLRSDRLYEFYNGTSMATPHVTGAVAMLRAVNPSLSPVEIRALLLDSATPTGDLRLGAGVLNVAGAFNALVPGSTAGGNAVRLNVNAGGAASEGNLAARGDIEPDAPFLPGQVLVSFDRVERAEALTQQLLGDRARVTQMPATASSHALVQLDIDGLDPASARQQTLDAIALLLTSEEVVYAEPNYLLQVR